MIPKSAIDLISKIILKSYVEKTNENEVTLFLLAPVEFCEHKPIATGISQSQIPPRSTFRRLSFGAWKSEHGSKGCNFVPTLIYDPLCATRSKLYMAMALEMQLLYSPNEIPPDFRYVNVASREADWLGTSIHKQCNCFVHGEIKDAPSSLHKWLFHCSEHSGQASEGNLSICFG
ncbi:hypothetical protein AB6A40_006439 [Gnathostoma spinigerum]|uniref:Uncharacterized protein n=1 Tax=Gnathostoma spinigerum TaxID=75299 RepID=A0ABD6EIC7_9BILA